MQRLVSLALVLCGLLLGMLLAQRPWADTASAANTTTKARCDFVGFNTSEIDGDKDRAEVYLSNISTDRIDGKLQWIKFDGDEDGDEEDVELDEGETQSYVNSHKEIARAKVTVKGTNGLICDGRMNWDSTTNVHQTQITVVRTLTP